MPARRARAGILFGPMLFLSPRALKKTRRTAKLAVDRAVLSFVNGLVYVMDGAAKPTMGNVARDLVLERGKLQLWRVRPREDEEFELGHEVHRLALRRHKTPLLVIPPLMVRPYVYDLRPEHSMLRLLRNEGFDVFFVDFGVPDEADEGVRLDDYVLDYVPRCVDAVLAASGAESLSLAGYCMGGIFSLLHVGTWHDTRVRNIVTIGAPVDFDKMGIITVAARLGVFGVDVLLDRIGNVPGAASSLGFKLMSGTRAITKYADLFLNLYDENYVRGFDAVNTWVNDLIPYPKEAFKQMVKEVVYGNKLMNNDLAFGDRRCDIAAVTCPLLAFAGEADNIATPRSTRAVLGLVRSTDKTLVPVPGGHVGVVAGSQAAEKVWRPMAAWLGERSG
jgi:polyhydroxyalkanoate synthase